MPNFSPTPILLPNLRNLWFGDGVPSLSTDGTYNAGDFLWITPTAGLGNAGVLGLLYTCVTGGSPGTWQVIPEASAQTTIFGGSVAGAVFGTFGEEGNLYKNVGNPIASNAADTTDDILDGIVLPAGAFDAAGRGLCITAQGQFATNGNNKRPRIWVNPTLVGATVNATTGKISGGTVSGAGSGILLFDGGVQTGSNVGWSLSGNLFKFGVKGSNTQYFQGCPIFGTTHGGITSTSFPTLVESAAMNIVVTGASSTTGAAADVVLNYVEINAMN
jgi:hypothetical protein